MKAVFLVFMSLGLLLCAQARADLYLVETSEGPGFASPDEVLGVLENGILPTFDALLALKADKKIIAGGLPAGSRRFVLLVEADSHAEVDNMLRDLVAWGVFGWTVTPLQSIEGRAAKERQIVKALKSQK